MRTILVIDDDDQLRQSFQKLLTEEGYRCIGAASGEAGIDRQKTDSPDLVILDMRLPGINGFETFRRIHAREPKLPVIIMTAYGTTETAIEATKMGAFDYILKPFDIPDILKVIAQGLDAGKFMRSLVEMDVAPEADIKDAIIGRSQPMQDVYKSIGRVASTDATVLIRGESGTGKELAARAVYQHSLRKDKPFLVINCVAIPDTLLESELFGYEKGAFTGAVHRRIGKIEQANGGTIFLDEIGDMPITLQGKILRLLEERCVERLGGRETIPVDVRIIAATNRNLEDAISEARFREDLYYRLKVVTIWLPPLRERQSDIPLLTDYFISRFSREVSMGNPGVMEETKALLSRQFWHGNVRELANTIHKALIFNRGAPVSPEDILRAISDDDHAGRNEDIDDGKGLVQWVRHELMNRKRDNVFEAIMAHAASIVIKETLDITDGNRSRAAKMLGLSRPTLHSKIDKYHLKLKTSVTTDK